MELFSHNKKYTFLIIIALLIGSAKFTFLVFPVNPDTAYKEELFSAVKKAQAPYTQSQAHISIKSVQEKINTKITGLAKDKGIVDRALKKENELKKTHYVFYTAVPAFHLLQDVAKSLYQLVFGKINGNFQFVRYDYGNKVYNQYKNVDAFLVDEISKNGIINDRESSLRTLLVSTNLALFGNVGFTGESTWYFFNEIQPWAKEEGFKNLKRKLLTSSLESFGFTDKYVDSLLELEKYLVDKDDFPISDLFQIFVPKEKIDSVGYLSWRMGIPFDQDFIKKLFNREKMTFGVGDAIPYSPEKDPDPKPGKQYLEPTVYDFTNRWKNNDPKALFMGNSLLANVKAGKFHLSSFLNLYTTKPGAIGPINWSQARLLVTNDMLLNPNSGIQIIRYNRLSPQIIKTYKTELNEIIKKIAAQKVTLNQALHNLNISLQKLKQLL